MTGGCLFHALCADIIINENHQLVLLFIHHFQFFYRCYELIDTAAKWKKERKLMDKQHYTPHLNCKVKKRKFR